MPAIFFDNIGGMADRESLLGRAFDVYQNMMQIAACISAVSRQRSIPRPRVLELSRRDTRLGDYLTSSDVVRYPTHDGHTPILTTPVLLPFADKSFDACVVTDVYEHIPAEQRPGLLCEMRRVTAGLVLTAAPHQTELVTRFDQIVFDFIWGKYGEAFEPLHQHHDYGLEPVESLIATLKAQGASEVLPLPCNYVYRWIHQILIYFDCQHEHPHWDLFDAYNRMYNDRVATFDYREPCYRYLLVVPTDPGIDLAALSASLRGPRDLPNHMAELDGVLTETFRSVDASALDRLRRVAADAAALQRDNAWALSEIARLNTIIESLQRDNQWALTEIELLRRAASPS